MRTPPPPIYTQPPSREQRRQNHPALKVQTAPSILTQSLQRGDPPLPPQPPPPPSADSSSEYAALVSQGSQPQQLWRSASAISTASSVRSRSLSFDSPTAQTFYRDLTPLPSPIVTASSPSLRGSFYTGRSPPTSAVSSRTSSRVHSGRQLTDISRVDSRDPQVVQPQPQSQPVQRQKKTYGELLPAVSLPAAIEPAAVPEASIVGGDDSQQQDSLGLGISTLRTSITPPSPTEEQIEAERRQQLQDNVVGIERLTLPGQVPSGPQDFRLTASVPAGKDDPLKREQNLGEYAVAEHGEEFEAYEESSLRKLIWREVRPLGNGTFSRVVLAGIVTGSIYSDDDAVEDEFDYDNNELVAVKIVELASAGGASRERIESGLKREVDILKNLHHPCLIHLIAFKKEETRALIVLPYCHGGDLFDLATSPCRSELLQPGVVRRLFAELVSAVLYLHNNNIVHRDIKLENVLLNVEQNSLLSAVESSKAVTTLTDFGLSRRIDPENPTLSTRCGSEDYAPPELIMGQPYDGRQTDAWALGVLLYALMEGRFPFDLPPPLVAPDGSAPPSRKAGSARNRVKHRIARVEWCWVRFRRRRNGGEDGYDYDHSLSSDDDEDYEDTTDGWKGARKVVEMCLRRKDSRWSVREIAESEFVKGVLNFHLERP
ncbi:kinase-like protein [Lipomyces starkeyi]